MHATAVTDVASFAFGLVAFEERPHLGAGLLVKSGKNVPLPVRRILFASYESLAGEDVPVGRHTDVAVVYVAGVLPVPVS